MLYQLLHVLVIVYILKNIVHVHCCTLMSYKFIEIIFVFFSFRAIFFCGCCAPPMHESEK